MQGVYIAHHPWLSAVAKSQGYDYIVKVGQSSRLGDRLYDSAYATNWCKGWRYLAAFEVASADALLPIEAAVLHAVRRRRIDGTELVGLDAALTFDALVALVCDAAARLGHPAVHRAMPVYPRTAPAAPAAPAEPLAEPLAKPLAEPLAAPAEDAIKPITVDELASKLGDMTIAQTRAELQLEARKYQSDACDMCVTELDRIGRTTLIVACRCGKTRIAQMVMSQRLGPGAQALFLVPTLELLWQTAAKLAAYWGRDAEFILVGSAPGERAGHRMTTDPAAIRATVAAWDGQKPLITVSTYQSSPAAVEGAGPFALTVFDECHKTCGSRTQRPSSYVLLEVPHAVTGARLFMTATPAYDGDVSMRDHALFGGVAYRYNLRQGINAGYVNDFEVQLVGASSDALTTNGRAAPDQVPLWRRMAQSIKKLFHRQLADPANTGKALETMSAVDYMAVQVHTAYAHMRETAQRTKLLVFCNTIDASIELMQRVAAAFEGGAAPALYAISSRTRAAEQDHIKAKLAEPGHAAIVFNCRQFQEGVEFEPLNGVFFSAPRHSTRDIVQSMCRALTRAPGKPRSVVYIPVPPSMSDAEARGNSPELGRFETLLPYAEALLSEDSRFYEYLIDPVASPYPIGWIGVHSDAQRLLVAARRAIRVGCRAAPGADRLLAKENIPWAVAFAELKRIVGVCRRYPKRSRPGDGVVITPAADPHAAAKAGAPVASLRAWYHDWVVPQYRSFVEGRPSALEAHQVRQLESLDGWRTRGGGGEVDDKCRTVSYPRAECIGTLARILEQSGGHLQYISIGSLEWNGIDATPMEMLSGYARLVSQRDSRGTRGRNRGFNIGAQEAADLDAVFGRWGLRWRKERYYPDDELDAEIAAGRATSRAGAAASLRARNVHGFLCTDPDTGEYNGPTTVLQDANERLREARARGAPLDPTILAHWPGPWCKYQRQDMPGVMLPVPGPR